ncbi:MAG: hypothetical protein M3N18_06290 [Actinomycetota bacterium]|nr:hypothetical protein [Actinomycetota bacterium]
MSLRRRLGRLEELLPEPTRWPEWDFEDQIDSVLHGLRIHRAGGTAGQFTDREITILGILHANRQLEGEPGEWELSSGALVSVEHNGDGTASVDVEGRIAVEDLPDDMRGYVERMHPDKQETHERKLYEGHEQAKERRDYWWHFYSPDQARLRENERRRRDRELLERNRASVGAPPLTPDELRR